MTHMLPIDGDYLDKNLILIITIEKLEINIDIYQIMVHPVYFRQSLSTPWLAHGGGIAFEIIDLRKNLPTIWCSINNDCWITSDIKIKEE